LDYEFREENGFYLDGEFLIRDLFVIVAVVDDSLGEVYDLVGIDVAGVDVDDVTLALVDLYFQELFLQLQIVEPVVHRDPPRVLHRLLLPEDQPELRRHVFVGVQVLDFVLFQLEGRVELLKPDLDVLLEHVVDLVLRTDHQDLKLSASILLHDPFVSR